MTNSIFPIKISLFFDKGDPSGICEAWMDNWDGYSFKIPRTFLEDKVLKKEISKPGVYFLFGQVGNDTQVYIGESEDVSERLKSHNNDDKKSWFSEVVVISCESQYLNKAKVKYLESVFYEDACKANRYKVDNSSKPTKSSLSRSDEATLQEFIHKSKILITSLGYKVFEEIVTTEVESVDDNKFYYRYGTEEQAQGFRHPEGFVVCKGSYVRPKEAPKLYPWIKMARKINKSKIVNDLLIEDVLLNSPSLAFSFVAGFGGNGNNYWKTTSGTTLGNIIENETNV